jgi:hypothetical protein
LAAANNPPLAKGEIGQAVRHLQHALIDLGYKLPVSTKKYGSPDGHYGKETKSAVLKIQYDQKLPSKDGVVGAQTLGRLDDLLKGKPFTPLPPIPGMDDGADILAKTEKVVLDTLGSGLMAGMGFSLHLEQSSGEVSDVTIFGESYHTIGQAVFDGDIVLEVDATIGPAALYDKNTDTFKVSRMLKPTLSDKALVVHEATHAMCDWKGRKMNALFSEMVAFVAEALFFLRATGGAKSVGHPKADKVYAKAFLIASLLRGDAKTPPAKREAMLADMLDDLGLAIRQFPEYEPFTHGEVLYDGRLRKG